MATHILTIYSGGLSEVLLRGTFAACLTAIATGLQACDSVKYDWYIDTIVDRKQAFYHAGSNSITQCY